MTRIGRDDHQRSTPTAGPITACVCSSMTSSRRATSDELGHEPGAPFLEARSGPGQVAVVGELQRRREQRLRDRLRALHPLLTPVLLADREALRDEGLLVLDRGDRRLALQHARDDEVGLDERPQHAEREERLELLEQLVGVHTLDELVLPCRQSLVEVGAERLPERLALLEEEVELQQVAQPVGLVPERLEPVGVARLRRGHERELADRARYEVVEDRVPVERGRVALPARDPVHGLGAAVVRVDGAVLRERVEHGRDAVDGVERFGRRREREAAARGSGRGTAGARGAARAR